MFQPYTMHKLNNRWFFTTKRARSCMNFFCCTSFFLKRYFAPIFFLYCIAKHLMCFFLLVVFSIPLSQDYLSLPQTFLLSLHGLHPHVLSNLLFYWFCNMIYYSFPCLSFYHTKCINWIIVTKYATYNLRNFSIHFLISIYTIKKPQHIV